MYLGKFIPLAALLLICSGGFYVVKHALVRAVNAQRTGEVTSVSQRQFATAIAAGDIKTAKMIIPAIVGSRLPGYLVSAIDYAKLCDCRGEFDEARTYYDLGFQRVKNSSSAMPKFWSTDSRGFFRMALLDLLAGDEHGARFGFKKAILNETINNPIPQRSDLETLKTQELLATALALLGSENRRTPGGFQACLLAAKIAPNVATVHLGLARVEMFYNRYSDAQTEYLLALSKAGRDERSEIEAYRSSFNFDLYDHGTEISIINGKAVSRTYPVRISNVSHESPPEPATLSGIQHSFLRPSFPPGPDRDSQRLLP